MRAWRPTGVARERDLSRSIEWPVRHLADIGRSSGGSQVLTSNLAFAASLLPRRFTANALGTPLITRNIVPLRRFARGGYLYMPQNAWAWLGPGGGVRESGYRLTLRVLSELALRRARATLRISESIPDRTGLGLPVLHNVLDVRFEEALEASRALDPGTAGSIVSVGSFVPYRNYERLIEAHRRYREQGGKLRLVLAGPAGFPQILARVKRLASGRDDVELRPHRLTRDEVLAMLRDCELAILPSLVEASPVSLLEALVLCRRIAASDIPGHHGIARGMLDGVAIFDPMSPTAILEALIGAERSEPVARTLPISTADGRTAARTEWAHSLERLVSRLREHAEPREPVRSPAAAPRPVAAERFPRVCIIAANPLSSKTSNGIIMSSLFAGWPKDRLTQIYFPVVVPHQPEFDVCTDFRMIRTSGRVIRIRGGSDDGTADGESEAAARRRLEVTARHHLLQYLRRHSFIHRWLKLVQEVWYAHSWIGAVVRRQLREIRPDVVYACLGNYCLTRVTCRACTELGLPLFIRVADDYVTSLYDRGPFSGLLRADSQRWFLRTLEAAGGTAGNSPIMAEEYGARYGGDWRWFATLVDPESYDPSPRTADGPLRLVFTGNVGLGRWQPLRQLALALERLRQSGGPEARLIIHSFPEQLDAYGSELDVPPITELAGWAPYEELPRIYHEADVLVHTESFEAAYTDYTALSFSGKLSQYMMAGRCVLAVAPTHLASSRAVLAAGGGISVGETDPEAIAREVGRLLEDRERLVELGRRGRQWAVEHVARGPAQERFRQELREVAAGRLLG